MGAVLAVWSTKGGVGVSTVAAMLAIGRAERGDPVLLVDLCGDQPAVTGVAEPSGPGVAEWCALPEPAPDALERIEVAVRGDLHLLHRGAVDPQGDPTPLFQALAADARPVVVDCGVTGGSSFRDAFVGLAPERLLVVRACYLMLRTVGRAPAVPTGVVFVRQPGRALGLADVEATVVAPVVAEIALDVAVANSVDAGLITRRLPRRLLRTLARVGDDAA